MKIEIDDEFHGLIPPLRPDEYEGLKEDIKKDGCREAIITWQGLILDGHNRYKICNELNLYYKVTKIELLNREAAKTWIERNQLNRRNLNPDQIRLIRGRLYNRLKGKQKDTLKQNIPWSQNGATVKSGRTREKLAKEFNVGSTTIMRDGKIAEYLSENPEEEKKVLKGTKTIKEVKKDKREMEAKEKPAKKKQNKNYYLTDIRLSYLREKIEKILQLLDVPARSLCPVTLIRAEAHSIQNELIKLKPYRKNKKNMEGKENDNAK
jgi:hypothetical protein